MHKKPAIKPSGDSVAVDSQPTRLMSSGLHQNTTTSPLPPKTSKLTKNYPKTSIQARQSPLKASKTSTNLRRKKKSSLKKLALKAFKTIENDESSLKTSKKGSASPQKPQKSQNKMNYGNSAVPKIPKRGVFLSSILAKSKTSVLPRTQRKLPRPAKPLKKPSKQVGLKLTKNGRSPPKIPSLREIISPEPYLMRQDSSGQFVGKKAPKYFGNFENIDFGDEADLGAQEGDVEPGMSEFGEASNSNERIVEKRGPKTSKIPLFGKIRKFQKQAKTEQNGGKGAFRGGLDPNKLDLSGNSLKKLPLILNFDYLVEINLSENCLDFQCFEKLQDSTRFPNVKKLDLSQNKFKYLGKNFYNLFSNLEVLDLRFNRLEEIAIGFVMLRQLTHLKITGNRILNLPVFLKFVNLKELKLEWSGYFNLMMSVGALAESPNPLNQNFKKFKSKRLRGNLGGLASPSNKAVPSLKPSMTFSQFGGETSSPVSRNGQKIENSKKGELKGLGADFDAFSVALLHRCLDYAEKKGSKLLSFDDFAVIANLGDHGLVTFEMIDEARKGWRGFSHQQIMHGCDICLEK